MPLLSIKNGGKVAIVNLQVHTTKYKHIVVFLLSMDQKRSTNLHAYLCLYACYTYDLGKFCYKSVKNINATSVLF